MILGFYLAVQFPLGFKAAHVICSGMNFLAEVNGKKINLAGFDLIQLKEKKNGKYWILNKYICFTV